MLTVRNPFVKSHENHPKPPPRKPLQSRNTNVLNSTMTKLKSLIKRYDARKQVYVAKEKRKESDEMEVSNWNKENIPVMIEGLDSSLGTELIEMRKRTERLKLEKAETEKMLKERDFMIEVWMENLYKRIEEQRKVETKIDRIFSFSKLRTLTKFSPVRSLREKEASISVLIDDFGEFLECDMVESVGENSAGESPDRRRIRCIGDFADSLELGSVSAESKC